jgi:5-dehydro-4-deoxyglucarate dehydratase
MLAPDALKQRITEGIMAFPATPFHANGELHLAGLEAHVAFLSQFAPTALVAAGGAGEVFSLSLAEHEQVVRTTVQQARGVPVIGGAGYGTPMAVQMAQAVEQGGGDAVLLLPPYLVRSEQEGLYRHIRAVADSVSIAVLPYSRDNAVIAPETMLRLADVCSNVIALKDGTGEAATAADLKRRAGDRLAIVNGAPTAEMFAAKYLGIGVLSYSSAVFTFAPRIALYFFDALRSRNAKVVDTMIEQFYLPLVAIRERKRGFAVSVVKAGLRVVGAPAGPVRAPLVDFDSEEDDMLAELLARANQWLT